MALGLAMLVCTSMLGAYGARAAASMLGGVSSDASAQRPGAVHIFFFGRNGVCVVGTSPPVEPLLAAYDICVAVDSSRVDGGVDAYGHRLAVSAGRRRCRECVRVRWDVCEGA